MTQTKKKKHKTKAKGSRQLIKKEYKDYTELENERIAHYTKRSKREPARFVRIEDGSGAPKIMTDDTDGLLYAAKMTEALGTPDSGLQHFLLKQLIQTFRGVVTTQGSGSERLDELSNNAVAILNGIQPRDEIEGMLAVQMIGVHNLAMETIKRAMITDQTFDGKQANVNQATKMLRTFTAQMEALKRYRTGGQHKVTVEHVHVNEGGQAIVGAVNQEAEGAHDKEGG